ncbi:hypothetical protein [Sphingobium fuliginis]|uniref:AB hydrolase-1 domain-containing protein n=1 Tax=Sphingobium fuliginis ATCC 27551 TaxID=1208342 RepID=A0A5B8CHM0_SPHSA|nr:hypothetical protein [Sphingobium fuliginis]QDC38425.1 hypothetical protein FIL70_15460 [Sphingobium fuliginis ATCC 27551]
MTAVQAGFYGAGDQWVDQMYVQYMIPTGRLGLPIVMVHGATLTGKSFETTPDGRMGWYEYFARKGFPSYVVDQVERGRSGFDQAPFNDVRSGVSAPSNQPLLRRIESDTVWVRFRFGPRAGEKYPDSQFPVEAMGELAKQAVPDMSQSLPADDPNYVALSTLAKQLKRAILLGHSQGARYPFETALLDPTGIAGLVAIEPPGCKADQYSPEQIAKLSQIPILIIFGDHIADRQSVGAQWSDAFTDCQSFVSRVNGAKGHAEMMHMPDLGIYGNSHMLMQDRNNLQIADLIIRWVRANASS